MRASPLISFSPTSPSFNSYSSANLAEIAARVVEELGNESDSDSDIFHWDDTGSGSFSSLKQMEEKGTTCCDNDDGNEIGEADDEDEFEFNVLGRKPDSPIFADEIFYNGQIKPIYPLFNTDLLLDDAQHRTSGTDSKPKTNRLPLGKLMCEERETLTASASCSSSEADDLDNLQPGTYCVWTPKASGHRESPGRSCKKSNSTGSSKRWKFRDLLYRSNSDGKDTFVFLTPNKKNVNDNQKHGHEDHNNNNKETKSSSSSSSPSAAAAGKVKAVEQHYVKNRAIKEEHNKRSYLPYRQDLVGFFNNVSSSSRNLHPS